MERKEQSLDTLVFDDLPIFSGIEKKHIAGALNCLNAKVRVFKKDSYLQQIGEKIVFLGILLSGSAYVQSITDTEERSIYSSLVRGRLIGSSAVFDGKSIARFDVIALTDCSVLEINPTQFLPENASGCRFRYAVMQNLLRLVTEENLAMQEKLQLALNKSLRKKVHSYLRLQAHINNSSMFTIPFVSREDFADYLGVNVSALSRELGRMRDEGILSFYKNSFSLTHYKPRQ